MFAASLGLLLGGFGIVRAMGKNHLYQSTAAKQPVLQAVPEEALTPEESEEWQDGWVKYKNTVYAYNEDILTFLIMGIDKQSDAEEVAEGTNGGQADALFLAVLDPRNRRMKVIGINRNTMTDIDTYDENGTYMSTVKAQIAIQHGFGNGMEESCEYQKKAVANLFYQLDRKSVV